MADKKAPLTLSDLLSRDAPAHNVPGGQIPDKPGNTLLGDREAIGKRTQLLRDKKETPNRVNTTTDIPIDSDKTPVLTTTSVNVAAPVGKPLTGNSKAKPDSKADPYKVTRSIQFTRATYRQMEKTLNFIAYKSGRRNVSFPKYFEKLHDLAREQPDLMNQLIAHFKTDLPD